MPILGGLTAVAALTVGHPLGVVFGLLTILWGLYLKDAVKEKSGILKPLGSVFDNFLKCFVVTTLGVRAYTFNVDARYVNNFPTDINKPMGCTRIATEGGNKGIDVPVFKADVDEVQAVASAWLKSHPRTKIVKESPGYVYATNLTPIFGFPDSIGVKVFKNKSRKTEVWLQSEQRVGQTDIGVNLRRMRKFAKHLNSELS